MEQHKHRSLRCGVYARKSSEEGLEQDFNSLQAQREACEAYIKSQQGEGWRLVKNHYDDGGLSGGTMERPALQRLLTDIREGRVDVVVVYKVDRLTRSLSDFAKMVEVFDARGVSFVSITQQFNTTTSMGRLTLNVLLSFAQFEREVTGERIRDKIAASKRKGMWMGGVAPLGYDVQDRQLVANDAEAITVRHIFERYAELGSVRMLKRDLDQSATRSKSRIAKNGHRSGGKSFSRGALYNLLGNPIYVGEVRHKGMRHPGQHQPIVDRDLWDKTQESLRSRTVRTYGRASIPSPSPLVGKLFDENGERLTPTYAVKGDRRYRYYVSRSLIKDGAGNGSHGWRVPALEVERGIVGAIKQILEDRIGMVAAVREGGNEGSEVSSVLEAATEWRRRLEVETDAGESLRLLVERAELRADGIRLSITFPLGSSERSIEGSPGHFLLTRMVPLQIRRRGVEMRLIIGGRSGVSTNSDPTLRKLITRAHHWFGDLMSGRSSSMTEIGKREGVGNAYVSRVIRVAFLAPEIVEEIFTGRQPVELTAQALMTKRRGLPLDWDSQLKHFAFVQPA